MAVLTHEVEKRDGAALPGVAAWLTVERLLYAAALGVGAFLRFRQLGVMPLLPWEAANTWPAYLAAHAQQIADAPAPSSALLYGLQWLLFWIGADGDAAARLVSAAAGSLLVLWPWAWRGWVGRGAALALAWLAAFDPWLVALSRLADGAVLGLALGLLALTGLMRLTAEDDIRSQEWWRRWTAVAIGLLLVSGALAWSWLPVLLLFGVLYGEPLRRAGLFTPSMLLWAGLSAALGATLGLMRLDGAAWVGTSLSVWLGQFTGAASYDPGWPWVRLLVDQPLLAVLGVLGLAVMAVRPAQAMPQPKAWVVFLWSWLAWGGVLSLLPGRGPLALPMLGLPLSIGAAWLLALLAARRPRNLEWRETGAIYATLAILVISGSFWAAALVYSRVFDLVMAQATAVIFLLAAAILIVYAVWADRRHAAWIALSALAIVLIMTGLRSGWQLNQREEPGQMDGFFARQTHPEIRLLVDDIETLSAHRAGTPHQLPVLVQVASYTTAAGELIPALPDPVLGWYLRAMRDVAWVPVPSPGDMVQEAGGEGNRPQPVAITLAQSAPDGASEDGYGLPEGYVGSAYPVEFSWLPQALGRQSGASDTGQSGVARLWTPWLQPLARWVIYRAAPAPAASRDVILWVDQTPQ
ncbi:MAG: hypothetical protein IT329_06365 [Caldilineaceae bacterium]|nr:hypothetical protein [Caldilineaceae bacterium]